MAAVVAVTVAVGDTGGPPVSRAGSQGRAIAPSRRGSNRHGMGGAYSLPGESWLLRAISSANRFSISGHFSIAGNVGSPSYGAG
jgi:hypothetical protein